MQRADTAGKHARVIELRVAGLTLEAIAAELGYADKSGVRYVLDKWVDDHAPTPESVAELRQRMLAQLDELHATYWPLAVGVRDQATGEWVTPPSEAAAALLLKVAERTARLTGLDRHPSGLLAAVTAEQIAAYLGWDPQEQVQDVESEEIDGDPRDLAGAARSTRNSRSRARDSALVNMIYCHVSFLIRSGRRCPPP